MRCFVHFVGHFSHRSHLTLFLQVAAELRLLQMSALDISAAFTSNTFGYL